MGTETRIDRQKKDEKRGGVRFFPCRQMLAAVKYVHESGFIHRDIKARLFTTCIGSTCVHSTSIQCMRINMFV